MKLIKLLFSILAVTSFCINANDSKIIGMEDPNRIEGSYIIVLNSHAKAPVEELAETILGQDSKFIKHIYSKALKGFSVKLTEDKIVRLASDENIAFIEADIKGSLDSATSWGLDRSDQRYLPLNNIFSISGTGAGVNAYILDSGIRTTHNEFTNINNTINFTSDTNTCTSHGTHVAGILGGATFGIATSVTIHDLRVADCNDTINLSDAVAAVDWVTNNHIKPAVVNMSFSVQGVSMETATVNLINDGVTVVTSAGNFAGNACISTPGKINAAITVGATDKFDKKASFSSFGSCVDLFAPGVDIVSASNANNSASTTKSGTSMSSPYVAGTVALYLQANTTATPANVHSFIVNRSTLNVLSSLGSGSPNRLLFSDITNNADPGIPQNVVSFNDCYGLNDIYWTAPSSSVTQYKLYRSNSSNFTNPVLVYSGTSTDKTVNVSSTKYFRVKACNGSYCGSLSDQVTATYTSFCW